MSDIDVYSSPGYEPYNRAEATRRGDAIPESENGFQAGAYQRGLNPDLFARNAQFTSGRPGGPRYHYKVNATGRRGLYKWEMIFYGFNGGLNKQEGDLDREFDRLAESTFDTRFERSVVLPLTTSQTGAPDPYGVATGLHHARIFNTLMVGAGEASGAALFKEVADQDLDAVTGYNPGSPITCLHPIVIGASTIDERLLVGLSGSAPDLVGDKDGTVDVTGHADLNPCWGAIQTFTNDNTILFYADNGLYALKRTQALSDAPVLTMGNIPDGGYAIGLIKLGNAPYRCYWAFPKEDNTVGVLANHAEGSIDIVSTNAEGFDPQPLDFKPYLTDIRWAGRYRWGIVAHDGFNLVLHNGERIIDTRIFSEYPADSDIEYKIRGVWFVGEDLYVRCSKGARGASTTTSREHFTLWLDADTLSWHRVSQDLTYSEGQPPIEIIKDLKHHWRTAVGAAVELTDHIGSSDLTNNGTVTASNGFSIYSGTSQSLSRADGADIEPGEKGTLFGQANADDATPAAQTALVAKWLTTGNQRSFAVYILPAGTLRFQVDPDGTGASSVSATTVGTIGVADFHWCARWDGTKISISLNGATSGDDYAEANYSSGLFDSTADFHIGASGDGTAEEHDGGQTDIYWWDRAITDAELTFMINSGSGRELETLLSPLPGGQGLPWSDQTEYLYVYENGYWQTQKWTRPGVNPYYLRQTSGATAQTGRQFSSGTRQLTTPKLLMPGLEGKPKAVERITFLGNLEASASDNSTPAQCTVAVGGVTATFSANHTFPQIAKSAVFDLKTVFDQLQLVLTGNQGSGGTDPTYYTPNFVPIKVEGYAWEPIGRLPDESLMLPG